MIAIYGLFAVIGIEAEGSLRKNVGDGAETTKRCCVSGQRGKDHQLPDGCGIRE